MQGVVDQDKLKKMSPMQRTEFEKVIFEEWTVEGRQETLEHKPDENQKKLFQQGKRLRKNLSVFSTLRDGELADPETDNYRI